MLELCYSHINRKLYYSVKVSKMVVFLRVSSKIELKTLIKKNLQFDLYIDNLCIVTKIRKRKIYMWSG